MARHSPATPSAVADRDRLPDDELALLRAAVWRQRQLVFFRLLPLLAVVVFVSAHLIDYGFVWLAALLPTVALGFTLLHAHRARAAASEISDDHVFDARALVEIDARSWALRIVPAVVVGIAFGVVFGPRLIERPRWVTRATLPLTLGPSQWRGEMEFQSVKYPFTMTFTEVSEGSVAGVIAWDGYPAGAFKGVAQAGVAGDHLELVDGDGDRKDLQVTGDTLSGTDKGGRATFIAHRLAPQTPPVRAPKGTLRAGEVPVGLVLSAADLGAPACEGFSVRFDTAVVALDPPRLWAPFDLVGSGHRCSVIFSIDLADEGGAVTTGKTQSWTVGQRIETLNGNNAGASVSLTDRSTAATLTVHAGTSTFSRVISLSSLRVQP